MSADLKRIAIKFNKFLHEQCPAPPQNLTEICSQLTELSTVQTANGPESRSQAGTDSESATVTEIERCTECFIYVCIVLGFLKIFLSMFTY